MFIMKVFLLDKFLLKINRIIGEIGSFSDGLSLVSYVNHEIRIILSKYSDIISFINPD